VGDVMTFDEIQAVYQAACAKHGEGAGPDALLTSPEGRAWLKAWADRTPFWGDADVVRKWVEEAEQEAKK